MAEDLDRMESSKTEEDHLSKCNLLAALAREIDRLNNWIVDYIRPWIKATRNAVLAAEGVVLFGIGATLMQIGEWFFAICCFFFLGVLLFAKALTLDHWAKKLAGCFGAVVLSALLIVITDLRKPDSERWSNLQKLGHRPLSNAPSAGNQPPPAKAQPPSAQSPPQGTSAAPANHSMTYEEFLAKLRRLLAPSQKENVPVTAPVPASNPVPAPTTPAPSSPPSSTTPESASTLSVALARVAAGVGSLDNQWRIETRGAFLNLEPGGYWVPGSGSPSQWAKDAVADRLKRIKVEFEPRWEKLQPEVQNVRAEVINRLSHPSQGQLSPLQLQDDLVQFKAAIDSANRPISDDDLKNNKVDEQRFRLLVDYLQSLQGKLRNYEKYNAPS
jgi:hypothetical protein